MANKKKSKVRRNKRVTKARSQFLHSANRMYERFGVTMGKHMFREFVTDIQQGRAEFVQRRSNRVTLWRIVHEGHPIVCVYDKLRKTIVTVLHDREYKDSQYGVTSGN